MLGNTPLHNACLEGNIENVDLALKVVGNDIDAKNIQFLTPLHIACKYGRIDIALKLIEFGADINGKPENNCRLTDTPLQLAILKKDLDLVKLLIEKGADVNAKNHNNFTALHIASFKGIKEIVEELIINKVKINDIAQEGKIKETPLHLACQNNHHEIAELLLKKSADTNARDANQNTPLHYSAWNNSSEFLITTLLDRGADLESKNKDGKTPLDYAIQNNSLKAVTLLLKKVDGLKSKDKGANSDILNKFNKKNSEYSQNSKLEKLLKDFRLKEFITKCDPKMIKTALDKLKSKGLEHPISHFKKEDFLSLIVSGSSDLSAKIETLKLLSGEGFDIYKTNANGDNLLSLALKKGDKELVEEIFKEENGFDLTKLLGSAVTKIMTIEQPTSCFSCLSTGNIFTICFMETNKENKTPSVKIKLEKETSKKLITALENRGSASASLGFSSSPN
jgi:ankyrin repeat protein